MVIGMNRGTRYQDYSIDGSGGGARCYNAVEVGGGSRLISQKCSVISGIADKFVGGAFRNDSPHWQSPVVPHQDTFSVWPGQAAFSLASTWRNSPQWLRSAFWHAQLDHVMSSDHPALPAGMQANCQSAAGLQAHSVIVCRERASACMCPGPQLQRGDHRPKRRPDHDHTTTRPKA